VCVSCVRVIGVGVGCKIAWTAASAAHVSAYNSLDWTTMVTQTDRTASTRRVNGERSRPQQCEDHMYG